MVLRHGRHDVELALEEAHEVRRVDAAESGRWKIPGRIGSVSGPLQALLSPAPRTTTVDDIVSYLMG